MFHRSPIDNGRVHREVRVKHKRTSLPAAWRSHRSRWLNGLWPTRGLRAWHNQSRPVSNTLRSRGAISAEEHNERFDRLVDIESSRLEHDQQQSSAEYGDERFNF